MTSTRTPSSASTPILAASTLGDAVREAEAAVTAERWHGCACWDSPRLDRCSSAEHAVLWTRARLARLESVRHIAEVVREALPTLRPDDVARLVEMSTPPPFPGVRDE